MREWEAVAAALLLSSALASRLIAQSEASAAASLSNAASGMTALVSSLTNSTVTPELVPQIELSMRAGMQLLQVLDGAMSDTDRLASEFKRKAANAASEPAKQKFYLEKTAAMTRQSNQLFRERAKVEQSVESLERIIAKTRSNLRSQTATEAGVPVRKAAEGQP